MRMEHKATAKKHNKSNTKILDTKNTKSSDEKTEKHKLENCNDLDNNTPIVREKVKNHYTGHRQRLKNRYLESGFSSFSEHEVLELIYFYAIPRRDTKPMAKNLLNKFGSIQKVFEATPHELMKIGGLTENSSILFSLMLQSYKVYITSKDAKIKLGTLDSVVRHLRKYFINQKRERFYLVCLDSEKRLINTHLISEGSINETPIYIRNIFEEIIHSNAKNVILAHNHPGGQCFPSKEDIDATNEIIKALYLVFVKVLDHVIFTDNDYYSFAKNNIILNSI